VSQERSEEQFAFAVVARVLAVTVEPYDVHGRQGAVDALLHYPDGRTAALEVSSIGPELEAGILNYLGVRRYCRSIAGITRTWVVQVPRSFHPADMRKIDKVLPRCEASRAENLSELAGEDQDIDDLLSQGVRATIDASAAGHAGSRVYFWLPAMGGFPGRGMASLPDELAEALRTPKMQSKIRKLAVAGLKECHLFLGVRPSAFSFPVYDGLAFGGPLPTEVPRLPDGLSQVWLVSGSHAGGVVRGISGCGWHRDHPYNRPDDLAVDRKLRRIFGDSFRQEL
jgi:hypothetical protein